MGEEVTFKEKIKTLNFGVRGRTRDRVTEGQDADGCRTKTTTDELGNQRIEHNNALDQVDVLIRAPHLRVEVGQREVRS